ncbi:MAG: glycosyltransferase [Ignavibacteria bacterium]|jgi:glycosyltransferase involved in cell wall biosynthesis|nr:glycosyltransferase [Ignavibacteria bacterium]
MYNMLETALKEQIEQLLLADKTKEAKELLFKSINSSSDVDAELYLLLGSAYAIESNNQLALQYFSRAYDLEPNNYNFIQAICNFLITNGDKKAAQDLIDRFNAANDVVEEQGEVTTEFDYMDFILGGGDALKYKADGTSPSDMNKKFSKPQPATNDGGFSYAELILNDNINDVLQKYNLQPLKENVATSTIPKDNEQPIPPVAIPSTIPLSKMLFTMYGWNETGGGTKLPKAVVKELAKRGFEVAVFYATASHPTNTTPYYMEKTIDDGVKLYGVYNRPTIFLDADNPMREVCDDRIVALFNDVLDEFQPQIINFNNFLGLSFEIATVAKKRGIPSTFTTHNYHLIDPKLYIYNNELVTWKSTDFFANSDLPKRYPMLADAYKQRVEKAKSILINDIDYVLAVSNRVKELLAEFSGNREVVVQKIAVVNQLHKTIEYLEHNPVKPHTVGDKLRFAFIGDGIPHKGAHIIAQALQFLPNKNITIDLWGGFDNEYGNAIKSIDKANIITLRGKYSTKDLHRISDSSDCLLFASICEDCAPLVLAEGLAMNLPIIASLIGGVEDFVVDGYNGCLYKAGSPKALAAVMNAIIENPFKLSKMREHCQIPYSFADYITHLENVCGRLVNGERPDADEFNLSFRDELKKMM